MAVLLKNAIVLSSEVIIWRIDIFFYLFVILSLTFLQTWFILYKQNPTKKLMKPLSELPKGEFAYIVDLRDKSLTVELFELGCFPGDLIRVVENTPNVEFMTFRCRKNLIHLYRGKARSIITNATSFHFCLN